MCLNILMQILKIQEIPNHKNLLLNKSQISFFKTSDT